MAKGPSGVRVVLNPAEIEKFLRTPHGPLARRR